jgi:hypothetical protein
MNKLKILKLSVIYAYQDKLQKVINKIFNLKIYITIKVIDFPLLFNTPSNF